MTIFPIIQPGAEAAAESYPLYREVAWDYHQDKPIWRGGSPVIIEGAAAVAVWAWNALHTVRYRHEIYTWDYGSEMEALIGQDYSDELKRAEAVRYVRECLLINPYITAVEDIQASFADGVLTVACRLVTRYGTILLGRDQDV